VLARGDGAPPLLVARALNAAGNLARDRADYEPAIAYHERALALRRELGDLRGIASSLNNLGVIARDRGDAEQTTRLCQEGLGLFLAAGDGHGAAIARISLGMAASQRNDYDRARDHYEESLRFFRQSGDTWHTACMLTYLARLSVRQGDVASARRDGEEGLALYRSTGDPWGISLALRIVIEAGVERAVSWLLEDLAGVALAWGQPERAARLGGAAERLRQTAGEARTGSDGAMGAVDLMELRAGSRAAWEAGRALTRREVIDEATALDG
jgi:tetratricopeptide (TPR) repeat protein